MPAMPCCRRMQQSYWDSKHGGIASLVSEPTVIAMSPTIDPVSMSLIHATRTYSANNPEHSSILEALQAHPHWDHLGSVSEFEIHTAYHTIDDQVRIADFPKGSIAQMATNTDTLPIVTVSPTDIYVEGLNFYCNQLPKDKVYCVVNESWGAVYWSDDVIVDTKTAFRDYSVNLGYTPSTYHNSKGERSYGYCIKHHKKLDYSLKLEINNPRDYLETAFATLRAWEQAGKPIYTVDSICKDMRGGVLSTILSMDGLVKPSYRNPTGESTYTTKTLDEYLNNSEFWEALLKNQPGLLEVFGCMSDETKRNAMWSAYSARLLSR